MKLYKSKWGNAEVLRKWLLVMCSGRHEEETGRDRWGHLNREPAQPAAPARSPALVRQEAAEPVDPAERPKLSLAPRSSKPEDAAAPDQPATPAPKKVHCCFRITVWNIRNLLDATYAQHR